MTRKMDLVVAGYVVHDGKILLIHHKKLNLWLPVGGHIEANEAPDEALKREIREETGLDVDVLSINDVNVKSGAVVRTLPTPFHVNIHSVGDHDHCCFYYVCKPKNPEALRINKELKGFRWYSRDELKREEIPEDVRVQCEEVFRLIDSNVFK